MLLQHLNEWQRRLPLATEVRLLEHGDLRTYAVAAVSETTGRRGVAELEAGAGPLLCGRVRAPVSVSTVGWLLGQEGFSPQANVKTVEGSQHPDGDAQFRYINEQVKQHRHADGEPAISVDAKKREQIGRPPVAGRVEVIRNTGSGNVGVDHDSGAGRTTAAASRLTG